MHYEILDTGRKTFEEVYEDFVDELKDVYTKKQYEKNGVYETIRYLYNFHDILIDLHPNHDPLDRRNLRGMLKPIRVLIEAQAKEILDRMDMQPTLPL